MFHEAIQRTDRRTAAASLLAKGKLKSLGGGKPRPEPGNGNDPIAKLYGSIQRLLFERADGLILHVTSATHGEGVSTIASALAERACAAGHRGVLLLRGYAPKPVAGGRPGPENAESVVARVDRGETLEGAVKLTSETGLLTGNLLDITSGGAPDPKVLRRAYDQCRKDYKLTIIDCFPTSSGAYFELIPSGADGVIFVIEAEKARPAVIQHSKEMLEQHGANIIGAVLNRARHYIPRVVYNRL